MILTLVMIGCAIFAMGYVLFVIWIWRACVAAGKADRQGER